MKIFTRILGIGLAATMLLAPLLFSQSTGLAPGTTAQADGAVPAEIRIVATDYAFDPSEFTVKPGQKVRVTMVNQGKRVHNIQFDLPGGKKEKISRDLDPGQSGTLEFTTAGPGTFTFKCPVDFHAGLGMKGKMIVK